MMIYPKPVVEIMGDIVGRLAAAKQQSGNTLLEDLTAANSNIKSIHYMYGHPLELIATLQEKTKNPGNPDLPNPGGKWDMWPVVMLFTDMPEQWDAGTSGYYATVTLQMVIAFQTNPSMKAAERMERNFKPILLPIYHELMKQISRAGSFVVQSQKRIPHTKWDRYYWGKTGLYGNSANTFNDFIDAIEIQNLILKINNQKQN